MRNHNKGVPYPPPWCRMGLRCRSNAVHQKHLGRIRVLSAETKDVEDRLSAEDRHCWRDYLSLPKLCIRTRLEPPLQGIPLAPISSPSELDSGTICDLVDCVVSKAV